MSKGISIALTLDINAYIDLACRFSPDQAICVQGPAGIGKSESTEQIAARLRSDFYKDPDNCIRVTDALRHNKTMQKVLREHNAKVWRYEFGLPVVMRRLSQITEGDIVGIPYRKDGATRSSTEFIPTDWLLDACDFPVILFLDERNRALEGVKQAVFELQDSKAFYGHSLHDETRVYVAENIGEQFNVQQLDPAEISRVALIHLEPTAKSWLQWAAAAGRVHYLVIEYIRQNEEDLENRKDSEQGKKYPDRRAWAKLSKELVYSGLIDTPKDPVFYQMAASMIGCEIALKFTNYCKERDKQIGAADIVSDWEKAKKRAGGTAITGAMYIEFSVRLKEWIEKNRTITQEQAKNIAAFMKDAPPEPRSAVWMSANAQKSVMFTLLPLVADLISSMAGASEVKKTPPAAPKQK